MKIPQLSTAFCGCSLRLGTIIIAWIEIVLQIVVSLILVVVVTVGSVAIAASIHENNMKEQNRVVPSWEKEYGRLDTDTWNPIGVNNQLGSKENEKVTTVLIGVGIAVIIFVLVIFLIQFIATIFLLLGAHKNRPGYLLFWLVLSVLSLIGSLGNMIRVEGFLFNAVFFVINLYFTWVVYSFYRQLKDSQDSSMQPAAGGIKLRGDDVPYLPTHSMPNAPPAYAYTQKE